MNSQLLPSVAARELQTRRTIRQSLTEWCRLCGFEPAAHHRVIIEELEAVARGECDRLAIFLPPGSAKSTYASVLFPPWLLATSPESAIIAASHTQELADRWGRKVRNLLLEHGPVLDIALSPDMPAINSSRVTPEDTPAETMVRPFGRLGVEAAYRGVSVQGEAISRG